ncbi:MAG: hypothetical protein QS748_14905, partial [Candidatus Endonucleobacter bathymodioli]|nr:hypothetical protein [Candidatus Endonucleobacter bathymodioli]
TICNLQTCLIGILAGNGNVQNLNIDSANITNTGYTGAVAKVMDDNALMRFIRIDKIFIGGGDCTVSSVGAVAGLVQGSSRLNDIMVANSFVEVIQSSGSGDVYHCFVGGVAGEVAGFSQLNGITIINSNVIVTGHNSAAAGVAARVSDHGVIDNVTVTNTHIEARNNRSSAGAGLGVVTQASALSNINVTNSTVKVFEIFSFAGGAAGQLRDDAVVQKATVSNTRIETMDGYSWLGVGVGWMSGASNFTVLNSINNTMEVHGEISYSGVGAGAVIGNANFFEIMGINTLIEVDSCGVYVSWGVGFVERNCIISNVQVIDSKMIIKRVSGVAARAVVGMDDDHPYAQHERVLNVTVTNSLIEVSGSETVGICPEGVLGEGVGICDSSSVEYCDGMCLGNATGEGVSIRTMNNDIVYVVYDNKVHDGKNTGNKHIYVMKSPHNKCQLNESHFLINDCGLKDEDFEGHENIKEMPWVGDCSGFVADKTTKHIIRHIIRHTTEHTSEL